MSEILPALIGFVISIAWLLAQLGWYTRIRKWYSQNIDDRQGLVVPSLLVITLPFVLSYLLQNREIIWLLLADVGKTPLGILLTSSLTAIGVLIANSILKEIDRRKDILNTSKLVYEYVENKGTKLQIPIDDLQSFFQNPIDQISPQSIYFQTKRLSLRTKTDLEGIDRKPIELILEKSSSFHQDLLTRIVQYFDSVNLFASTVNFLVIDLQTDTLNSKDAVSLLKIAYKSAIISYMFSLSIRIYLGRYLSKRLYCDFDQNEEKYLVDELRHQGALYQKLIDDHEWPFDNPVDKELQFLKIGLQQEDFDCKTAVQ